MIGRGMPRPYRDGPSAFYAQPDVLPQLAHL